MSWRGPECPRTPPDLSGTGGRIRKCARLQGPDLAPPLLKSQADRPRPRVRAPHEVAGRRVAISGTSGRQRPTANSKGHSRQEAPSSAPASNRRTVRCCTHVAAAETSPGTRANYPWVKGCAAGTDRWPNSSLGQLRHQRLASTGFSPRFACSERGRFRGGNSCDHAEASTMRTRVSHAWVTQSLWSIGDVEGTPSGRSRRGRPSRRWRTRRRTSRGTSRHGRPRRGSAFPAAAGRRSSPSWAHRG